MDGGLLMRTVGIEECPRNIYDLFASPDKHQPRAFGHDRDRNCLKVLFRRICEESILVFRVNHDCHSLLRLGDGDLCAVKAFIFARNLVQVYAEARCKLTDSHRNTAGTEVVAFFDDAADFFAAEHPLDLTLCGRVTFLYLGTAYLDRGFGMNLGGACGTADAVTSRASAEQDDDVAGIRVLADDGAARCGAHNGTDLHSFCHIGRMINFFNITGSQTDLVSVGAVSPGSTAHQLLLRKLAL